MSDGYPDLGVSANPFAPETTPGVPASLWIDRRVPPPGASEVVEVIGPRGSGKTSLLLHWRSQRPGPYLHVATDRSRWRPPPLGPIVYWDEADRIPRLIRRKAVHAMAAVGSSAAVATRRPLGPSVRHPRLAHRRVVLGRITAAEVQHWAATRIREVQVGPADRLVVDDEFAARLAAGSGGSWRAIAEELHTWVARLAAGR